MASKYDYRDMQMAEPAGKYNVLLIMTDQQRYDHLGCAGNSVVLTPRLDALASDGMMFTRHYVNNPLCMPSRATLLTGLTPRAHGVRTNGINLSRSIPTVAGQCSANGYRTHVVGKLHLETNAPNVTGHSEGLLCQELLEGREAFGFQSGEVCIGHGNYVWGAYQDWLQEKLAGRPNPWDIVHPELGCGAEQTVYSEITEELHHSSWVADRTIDFLTNRDSTRPFFLQCSFPDPHHPYCPPKEYADMYSVDAISLPVRREGELGDLPPHFRQAYNGDHWFSGRSPVPTGMEDHRLKEIIRLTYGMVSLIDKNVGRILDSLTELGLADDTIIIFTSDHGDLMGDHWLLNKGPFHFDGLVRVPFIVKYPGVTQPRSSTASLSSHLDVAPTILEMLGLPIPEGPCPPEPEAPEQRPAWVGRSLIPVMKNPELSVQDSVLIENDEDYIGANLRSLVTEDWKMTCYSNRSFGELFDLKSDPCELLNLWDVPEYAQVKLSLKQQLLARIMDTDSPLPRRLCHA